MTEFFLIIHKTISRLLLYSFVSLFSCLSIIAGTIAGTFLILSIKKYITASRLLINIMVVCHSSGGTWSWYHWLVHETYHGFSMHSCVFKCFFRRNQMQFYYCTHPRWTSENDMCSELCSPLENWQAITSFPSIWSPIRKSMNVITVLTVVVGFDPTGRENFRNYYSQPETK